MKVCILTAGIGSRMGDISQSLNKSILPTNKGAIISEIFSSFKKDTKFVVAVGYKKKQVKDYIALAHPDMKKNISYVDVDNYNKKYSGPGYSLFKCKKKLMEPFYAISCDTLLPNNFKANIKQNQNILFGKKIDKNISKNYCNFEINKKIISKIYEKKKYKNNNFRSFSGLIYICDYQIFWKDMKSVINVKKTPQISDGLTELLKNNKLLFSNINWIDVGKFQDYQNYINQKSGYDFSKKNEAIYIINNRVIKFFADDKIVNQRYKKSKLIDNVFPILKKKNNFYYYNFAKGSTLYEVKNQPLIFKKFLIWAEKNIWLKKKKDKDFYQNCNKFYKIKTYSRLKSIKKKYNNIDELKINNKKTESINNILKKIDWQELSRGLPYFIHGDLQFDNILHTKKENFLLLDWRDSFGKYIDKGDIYYDLAKLLGGILINYKKIKVNKFHFLKKGNNIKYNIIEKGPNLRANLKILTNFIKIKKLDINKIYTLTGLIYLNMSPLHHSPFDKILFGLSKELLIDKNYIKNLCVK